jgi:DnaD/phage-associated family protein
MAPFKGFPDHKVRLTPVPAPVFTELLPEIDDLDELKLTLYILWRLDRMEGDFRGLRQADLAADARFMAGLGASLELALGRAVQRGTLLAAALELESGAEQLYFLNSPRGRAAVEAIHQGRWRPSGDPQAPVELALEAPNIFKLYEENIGPLTPLIADALRAAQANYPEEWIADAIRKAVENNKRNWRYAEAILERWKEGGRREREDRRDTEKDRRRYADWEN